jgi:hypothetical protein
MDPVVHQVNDGSNHSAIPTQEAWDHYRATISRLYFVENEPLKKVRAIMAEHYGFRAT